MFVVNVFEQTKGKEMDLICNQVVSKIMEKLLPLANSENLQHFADLMLNDMRIICTDPYASHVLEKVCYLFLHVPQGCLLFIYIGHANLFGDHL
jgi:nucleolar protein 9